MNHFGRVFLGILAAAALTWSGCAGTQDAEATTLYVDEDGMLEQVIVETVEEDAFTQEELRNYIRDDLAEYAETAGSEAVTLESCRLSGNTARITLNYASAGDYAAYNQVECFLGTEQEARDAGYNFDGSFLDGSGNAVDMNSVQISEEAHVLILEEVINVRLPEEVLYTTSNASVSDGQTVTVEGETGFTDTPVYIIY